MYTVPHCEGQCEVLGIPQTPRPPCKLHEANGAKRYRVRACVQIQWQDYGGSGYSSSSSHSSFTVHPESEEPALLRCRDTLRDRVVTGLADPRRFGAIYKTQEEGSLSLTRYVREGFALCMAVPDAIPHPIADPAKGLTFKRWDLCYCHQDRVARN